MDFSFLVSCFGAVLLDRVWSSILHNTLDLSVFCCRVQDKRAKVGKMAH